MDEELIDISWVDFDKISVSEERVVDLRNALPAELIERELMRLVENNGFEYCVHIKDKPPIFLRMNKTRIERHKNFSIYYMLAKHIFSLILEKIVKKLQIENDDYNCICRTDGKAEEWIETLLDDNIQLQIVRKNS